MPATRRLSTCRYLPLLALPVLLAGCGTVPQDRFDALVTANRSLEEQVVGMANERDASALNVRTLQDQINQIRGSFTDLQGRYDLLAQAFREANSDNEDYLRRITQLEVGPLPPEVEQAIMELARLHPDIFTFDSRKGMLRFASDFTFDSGSAALRSDASRTIEQLACILNTPAARELEARIVGHTDNVPIGRPETRRLHPTNVHLSVHRSISVRDGLVTAGLEAGRIQVAGYGEFRPLVTNSPQGAAENRRVEIYLAPLTGTVPAARAPRPVTATPEPRTEQPRQTPPPSYK